MPISTKISIEIDGERLSRFSELQIFQKVNAHHEFALIQPLSREFVDQAIDKSQSYIGKEIIISIESSFLKTKDALLFKGIILQSEILRESGAAGKILIKGFSPTILLEGNPHIKSFNDKNITDIANEVLSEYSKQQLKSSISAQNTSSLPYTVQYNESDFSFLKRLSQKKGEWFYYNGSELILGNPKSNTLDLDYGRNLHSLKIDMKAQPLGFTFLGYEPTSADTQEVSSFEINHQIQGYSKSVFESSKRVYPEPKTHLFSQPIPESGASPHLSDRVQKHLEGKSANLVTAYGESDETGIRVGDIVNILEPAFSATNNPLDGIKEQNFGQYIITEIEHYCDETGKYYNTFKGVPSSVSAPPYSNVLAHPQAGTQPATVIDNNDPQGLGRVKVQFPWQKMNGTPWVRMTNPHAGGGKGMYFIPEIGEEVLIAFENNNAEKPFVLGAMYNGSESSGYATGGNDNKVIQTRSGCKVIINDAQGSIYLEDPSGNTFLLDGKGNIIANAPRNMSFTAGENMSFQAGMNISSSATMNISQSAGASITESAGMNHSITAGGFMNQNSIGDYNLMAANIMEIANGERKSNAKETKEISQKREILTEKDSTIHSQETFHNNAGEKTNTY